MEKLLKNLSILADIDAPIQFMLKENNGKSPNKQASLIEKAYNVANSRELKSGGYKFLSNLKTNRMSKKVAKKAGMNISELKKYYEALKEVKKISKSALGGKKVKKIDVTKFIESLEGSFKTIGRGVRDEEKELRSLSKKYKGPEVEQLKKDVGIISKAQSEGISELVRAKKGKKPKRKPSGYNLFTKHYFATNEGATVKGGGAGKAWKALSNTDRERWNAKAKGQYIEPKKESKPKKTKTKKKEEMDDLDKRIAAFKKDYEENIAPKMKKQTKPKPKGANLSDYVSGMRKHLSNFPEIKKLSLNPKKITKKQVEKIPSIKNVPQDIKPIANKILEKESKTKIYLHNDMFRNIWAFKLQMEINDYIIKMEKSIIKYLKNYVQKSEIDNLQKFINKKKILNIYLRDIVNTNINHEKALKLLTYINVIENILKKSGILTTSYDPIDEDEYRSEDVSQDRKKKNIIDKLNKYRREYNSLLGKRSLKKKKEKEFKDYEEKQKFYGLRIVDFKTPIHPSQLSQYTNELKGKNKIIFTELYKNIYSSRRTTKSKLYEYQIQKYKQEYNNLSDSNKNKILKVVHKISKIKKTKTLDDMSITEIENEIDKELEYGSFGKDDYEGDYDDYLEDLEEQKKLMKAMKF